MPLTRKIIILVNDAVPWVKTNGDTKSCYTYVQIGKICNFQSLSSWKSAIFMMTSQGERFAELTYTNFCYTRPLFRLRNACISSLVPCLNIGLLPDAATREVIAVDSFRVASTTKQRRSSSKETSEGLCAQALARNTVETWMVSFSRWLSTRPKVSSGYHDKLV